MKNQANTPGQIKIIQAVAKAFQKSWHVILWDDDESEFDLVIQALMKAANLSHADALAMTLHAQEFGNVVVCATTRERAEAIFSELRKSGLIVLIRQIAGSSVK